MKINGNAAVPPNPQPQPANPQGEHDPQPVSLPQQNAVIGGDAPAAAAVDDVVNVAGDADEPAALAFGAKRPLKSDAWPHFTRFLDMNGVMKAKCKYYRKILGGDNSNGTSHLRNHTKEYPLRIVDHLYFKIFCNGLQPLFKVPSRNTTKKDILAIFPYVPAPHTSEKLATVLHNCLMSWNVDYYYLSEDVIPRAANVCVLEWRVNIGKYPLLQEVARDLLAVPVTSVASESAFSSGGIIRYTGFKQESDGSGDGTNLITDTLNGAVSGIPGRKTDGFQEGSPRPRTDLLTSLD
ncbi:Putative AC transposase [Linum grandiflorum]